MTNRITGNSVYFTNEGAYRLNQQKSEEMADVREKLLHYPPFRARLESTIPVEAIRRVGAAPSATGSAIITLTFTGHDPGQTFIFHILPSDGPIIYQAAQFLAGIDIDKPVFPEAPPVEEEETDTRPRNLDAPRTDLTTDPVRTLENRITAASSQGNDALLKTIVDIFKEFTATQKAIAEENRKGIEALARNMHCYSHGFPNRNPAPSDEPPFDSSAFNFNPGPDSNSRPQPSGPIRHHTNRSARDNAHPYARSNNLNNDEPYQRPPAFNPASDPINNIEQTYQHAIRELQQDRDRQIQALELRNQSLQEENQNLNRQLIGTNEYTANLLANISEKAELLGNAQEERNHQDGLLQNLANELQSVRAESLQTQNRLAEEIQQAQQDVANSNSAVDLHRNELQAITRTLDQTTSSLQNSQQAYELLRAELGDAQKGRDLGINQLNLSLNHTNERLLKTLEELTMAQNRVTELQAQLAAKDQEREDLLQLQALDLQQSFEQLQKEREQLSEALEQKHQALTNTQQIVFNRDETIEQLNNQLTRVAELEAQLARKDQERDNLLQLQAEGLQQSFEQLQKEQEQLNQQISEITAQKNTLHTELQVAQFQNEHLQTSLNELEGRIQQERESALQDLQNFTENFNILKGELNTSNRQHDQINQKLHAENQRLLNQINDDQLAMQQHQNAIAQLEKNLEALTHENLVQRLQALQRQNQNSELQASQNVSQDRINELESEKSRLFGSLVKLSHDHEILQREHLQSVEQLRQRMALLQDRLARLQQRQRLVINPIPSNNNNRALESEQLPQQKKIWEKPPVPKHMSIAEQMSGQKKSIPKMMALPKKKEDDDEKNGIYPIPPVYVPLYRPSTNPTGNHQSGSVNLGRLALKGLKKFRFR